MVCEVPCKNLDIKEMCIVVMMVTGTMFEIGEVSWGSNPGVNDNTFSLDLLAV